MLVMASWATVRTSTYGAGSRQQTASELGMASADTDPRALPGATVVDKTFVDLWRVDCPHVPFSTREASIGQLTRAELCACAASNQAVIQPINWLSSL